MPPLAFIWSASYFIPSRAGRSPTAQSPVNPPANPTMSSDPVAAPPDGAADDAAGACEVALELDPVVLPLLHAARSATGRSRAKAVLLISQPFLS